MQRQQPAAYEIPGLHRVNQDLLDHLAAEKAPPIYDLTPDEARSVLLRAQSGAVRKPHARVKRTIKRHTRFAIITRCCQR